MYHSTLPLENYREQMFVLKETQGYSVVQICRLFNISRTTYYRWQKRRHLPGGLKNCSSRPKTSPRRFTQDIEKKVLSLRRKTGFCPLKLAILLQREGVKISSSGVYSVLKRYSLNRRRDKKAPPRRYEKREAFDLVHVDVKYLGRLTSSKNRPYQFSAVDDATRLAFAKIYHSKSSRHAAQFLAEVPRFFGARMRAVMTDNGFEFTKPKGKRENHKFEKMCSSWH